MPASKEQTGTWRAQFYYKDWTGTNRKKCKRGFKTKKEAQDWESSFKLQKSACLDMTFRDFWKVYEAATLAGLDTMPIIIKDCSDDEATVIMVIFKEKIFFLAKKRRHTA